TANRVLVESERSRSPAHLGGAGGWWSAYATDYGPDDRGSAGVHERRTLGRISVRRRQESDATSGSLAIWRSLRRAAGRRVADDPRGVSRRQFRGASTGGLSVTGRHVDPRPALSPTRCITHLQRRAASGAALLSWRSVSPDAPRLEPHGCVRV